MSRFLVTGATGFIGSAIVRELMAGGHEVAAPGHAEFDLLAADDADFAALVVDSGATHCVHAAWYTNHADYLTHEINRQWLAASLRLARACAGIRFIGLGTCLEHDLPGARTLYAECKRALAIALLKERADVAWARVFFVYGPGDRAGRLIPSMIERFGRGERAGPTYGGLRRDYIHVDDLASQIVRLTRSDFRGALDLGTGEAPTLSDIFAAGAAAFGRSDLAERNDETGGQPPIITADMALFRQSVGEPRARDIETGLRDLVA